MATLYSSGQLESMYGACGPVLANLRGTLGLTAANGYALAFSDPVDGSVPSQFAGAKCIVESAGIQIGEAFGQGLAQPPSPTQVATQMISGGQAKAVMFMEIWEKSGGLVGEDIFVYLGIYVAGPNASGDIVMGRLHSAQLRRSQAGVL